jgi:hypothetical protein
LGDPCVRNSLNDDFGGDLRDDDAVGEWDIDPALSLKNSGIRIYVVVARPTVIETEVAHGRTSLVGSEFEHDPIAGERCNCGHDSRSTESRGVDATAPLRGISVIGEEGAPYKI